MDSFRCVETLEQVKTNLMQFQVDIIENKEFRRRYFPYFRQWYYFEGLDMFAPSKYIGYQNMNAIRYIHKDPTTDGRLTEAVLKEWFVRVESNELMEELIKRFGKVNKRSQIHILKP